MYFVSQLLNGLGIGSIYALVALGYSMVYGIVKLINFAHGDLIMVGGYAVFQILLWSQPLWVAVLGSVVFCAVVGMLIERVAYHRLLTKGAPRIALLITAIGVSLLLQNLYQLLYGSSGKSMPKMFVLPDIYVGDVQVSTILLNIVVALLVMAVLQLLVGKTKIGKAMRATSEDPGAATLMGIDTNMVILFTFAIGSALAAVGSVLFTNAYPQISPMMGGMLGLKAFVAAVFGGIGSIPGAMVGGFALGIAESLNNAYGKSTLTDAVVFGMLIIILLVKPAGLFGKNVKEKV
ncbi:branched-chain amino acid ABC transporter permease [Ruminococcaceae bacterium OttesenSCG-928-A16]|nr:branched-chain amino acid ABC transporter permease [Ruminococcaceae bacterium OttesenSCG-928-A16]